MDYFVERNHALVSSASLVPQNDPTLLFTNAGMVQFKNVFLGEENREYSRATSSQKCVRAGGKHNDLEMVGRTARHHTFFEMLGNFSFGDYFKKEAVAYGWEFLTETIRLPQDRLYVSVFKEDDEAYKIWNESMGLASDRIVRLGEKDNFWAMGATGPCGPCSEIYVDQGDAVGCGQPTCAVGCDCDRYLEIWNLVFMQYDRDESGKMTPLPKPSIDTGMGLERLAAVVQGKTSNYESDLIMDLIQDACEITGRAYGKEDRGDISLRVLVDHARAAAFLVGDGVLPSNEGRGYVLRRIMRRALRHGKLLDKSEPFFHRLTDRVVDRFFEAYPDLETHRSFIDRVVLNEEENFGNTLTLGMQRLDETLGNLKSKNQSVIPGEEVFKLHDTYGFPVDLAEETARDAGYTLDMEGFDKAMQAQKEKAMASWKGSGEKGVAPFFNEFLKNHPPTVFTGYESINGEGKVLAVLKNQESVPSAGEGEQIEFLTDETPFYGESGGQAGDSGHAFGEKVQLEILEVSKPLPQLTLHKAKILKGTLGVDQDLKLEVNAECRRDVARNHTATHLLHAALKEVLGDHVKQAGSLVTPNRLRFDYAHFSPLSEAEKSRIEKLVNEKIQENILVATHELTIEDALNQGAVALFGEKYGDRVRVVSVPGFSKELCGGTHATATGNIAIFKILSETGIASGVRRIEALTGPSAFAKIQEEFNRLGELRNLLKAQPEEDFSKLNKLIEKNRQLEKEVRALKEKLAGGKGSSAEPDAIKKIGDVNVLVKNLDGMDAKTLRTFIDNAKNRIKSGVIVAGTASDGKAALAVGVTPDLCKRFNAGALIKEIAGVVGGTGGGRPDMAQAGGNLPDKLEEALKLAEELIAKG